MGAFMKIVEAKYLSASYRGGESIFTGLSLDIHTRENTVILGPSGSGKSTLLKILSGIKKPDSGSIVLACKNGKPARRGLMFQHPLLLPWLSVQANVQMGSRYDSNGADSLQLLAAVGLADYARRRPETLSGGQRQRVSLARALAHDPDVLMLDEPFSALDKELRSSLRNEVIDLAAQRNIPIVLVTHDVQEAHIFGGQILQMSELAAQPDRQHLPQAEKEQSLLYIN